MKYKVRKRKKVFSKGPIQVVDCLVDVPGRGVLSRQILEHGGSVVIIPRVSKDKYILIKQFRYSTRTAIWEWPAGGVEKGETLHQAAKRELSEEVMLWPKKLKKVVSFYPSPGVSEEVMHLYLAEQLTPKTGVRDEDEEMEIHEFSFREISKMVESGKINDAKTLIGYFYLKNLKNSI